MNRSNIFLYIFCIVSLFIICSCKKYLERKPDDSLDVINELSDLQQMLDNTTVMNTSSISTPEIASDNYYILFSEWSSLTSLTQKNAYVWEDDVFNDSKANDWFNCYRVVLYSNIILENLTKFSRVDNSADWDNIKGSALFFRAFNFFNITQIWTLPYDKSNSAETLGIPLKVSSDFENVTHRASLEETYKKIISDLMEAVELLPYVSIYKTRPSKASAFGLLARIYLSMREYKNAGKYADSCLNIYNSLMDYNDPSMVTINGPNPFKRFNTEVIFHSSSPRPVILTSPRGKIDSILFLSYQTEDLRKSAFFAINGNTYTFKGSYDGSSNLFNGISTDEIILMKAECLARSGDFNSAIEVLNSLLEKRYSSSYVPLTAANQEEALNHIIVERRKELIFRQIRWMDLKRLNFEGNYSKTIVRDLDGTVYQLMPNDKRYAFPIPDYIIESGNLIQNPR